MDLYPLHIYIYIIVDVSYAHIHIHIYNPWTQNLVQVMTGCIISHRTAIYTRIKKLQLNAYRSSVQNSVEIHHFILLFILQRNQQDIITDPRLCTFAADISGRHDHRRHQWQT